MKKIKTVFLFSILAAALTAKPEKNSVNACVIVHASDELKEKAEVVREISASQLAGKINILPKTTVSDKLFELDIKPKDEEFSKIAAPFFKEAGCNLLVTIKLKLLEGSWIYNIEALDTADGSVVKTVSGNEENFNSMLSRIREGVKLCGSFYLEKSELALRENRNHALVLGFGPALLSWNLQKPRSYYFASIPLAGPFWFHPIYGASAGGGISIYLSSSKSWKMDFFVHAFFAAQQYDVYESITWKVKDYKYDIYSGVGIGIGFHYTFPTGITLGFKVPFFGTDIVSWVRYDAQDSLIGYYKSFFWTVPIFDIGYRF